MSKSETQTVSLCCYEPISSPFGPDDLEPITFHLLCHAPRVQLQGGVYVALERVLGPGRAPPGLWCWWCRWIAVVIVCVLHRQMQAVGLAPRLLPWALHQCSRTENKEQGRETWSPGGGPASPYSPGSCLVRTPFPFPDSWIFGPFNRTKHDH